MELQAQPHLRGLSTAAIDASRRLDNTHDMAREIALARTKQTRSTPLEFASKVKAEAGRRQIFPRNVFIEMGQVYEKPGSGKKKP